MHSYETVQFLCSFQSDGFEGGRMTPLALSKGEQMGQQFSVTRRPSCFPCPDCDKTLQPDNVNFVIIYTDSDLS